MKPAIRVEDLTRDERLDLIEELWESLEDSERDAVDLTKAQGDELDRRLDKLERDGPAGLSPEELRQRFGP